MQCSEATLHESEELNGLEGDHRLERLAPLLPQVAAAVAGFAALFDMLRRVVAVPRMPSLDYWSIYLPSLNPDGSFAESTTLLLQNEHPQAAARVTFVLNAWLSDGSNRPLAAWVFCLALLQIAMLTYLSGQRGSGWRRRALFVGVAAALIFSPTGIHNFQQAMSGTAWFSANVFALGALILVCRRRPSLAAILGLAASASYGTGLMVWPALMTTTLALDTSSPRPRRVVPIVAGWLLSWCTYASLYVRPRQHASVEREATEFVERALGVLANPIATVGLSSAVGAVAAVVLVTTLSSMGRESLRWAAPALGLVVYAAGAAVLIGLSRDVVVEGSDPVGRYNSIGSIFLVGTLGVVSAAVGPTGSRRRVMGLSALAVGLAVLGISTSDGVHERMDRIAVDVRESAIAVRLGHAGGYVGLNDAVPPRLEELGHYPFSPSFDLDCGELGSTLDDDFDEPGEGSGGELEERLTDKNSHQIRVGGWYDGGVDGRPDCILLVDEDGRVVGLATGGIERGDLVFRRGTGAGFVGVAPVGAGRIRAVAVHGARRVEIAGEIGAG